MKLKKFIKFLNHAGKSIDGQILLVPDLRPDCGMLRNSIFHAIRGYGVNPDNTSGVDSNISNLLCLGYTRLSSKLPRPPKTLQSL